MDNTNTPSTMLEQIENLASDTPSIAFSVRTRPVTYGDGKTFYRFRVVMWQSGRVVGIEDGPCRTHAERADARRAGYQRIDALKQSRLFVVRVTKKDIANGEGHSCRTCAIAQALWREQARLGLDRWRYDFRVEPYGSFVAVEGIVLDERGGDQIATGEGGMPDVVVTAGRSGHYREGMEEWARQFDEWHDSQCMSLAEWRKVNGYSDGERPFKPSPCSFVLNLSEMRDPNAEQVIST